MVSILILKSIDFRDHTPCNLVGAYLSFEEMYSIISTEQYAERSTSKRYAEYISRWTSTRSHGLTVLVIATAIWTSALTMLKSFKKSPPTVPAQCLASLLCVLESSDSNIGPEVSYAGWGYSCFFSVPPDTFWDSTLKHTMTESFHLFPS
jgi:hypothetical protein